MPARQAHKRVDTKVSTLLRITHFLRGHGADCRHVTAAKQGSGRGVFLPQRRTACAHVSAYSQCRIPFCYTYGLLYAGRDRPVSRNSLTCYTGRHLRIRRLILFIFAGAVYDNALTDCAALLCRACVDLITCVAERYLTLRTGCERHGRKNPLPFPYFEAVTYRKSAPD